MLPVSLASWPGRNGGYHGYYHDVDPRHAGGPANGLRRGPLGPGRKLEIGAQAVTDRDGHRRAVTVTVS